MSRAAAFLLGVLVTAALGALIVVPLAISAGSMLGGDPKPAVKPAACGDTATTQLVARNTPKVAGFTAVQVRNGTAIVQAGQDANIPPRGWVIAVAVAMQETGLRNLANDNAAYPQVVRISTSLPNDGVGHDHDSVGVMQQRPVEGDGNWGTVKELMDPRTAATKFYQALVKIAGWQTMPLTRAGQRVQRSAYPDAYAKHEDNAARLVDALTGGAAKTAITATAVGRCAAPTEEVTSGGWVKPVQAPVGSGFRTASRPGHDGVDLSARRGLRVVAAAAGTVVHMECDKAEIGYDCNRDGSPSTPGCGWYLDIRHAGGIITRYCHLLRRPFVDTGDKVTAGQPIGQLGTSGHSSGPHLHFEVHTRNDRSAASAVDPVKFMKQRGAPLGETDTSA